MSLINREILLSFEKMDADLCASCGEHHTAEDVIMMIKTAPTVDAVPVVRCRERIHRTKHGNCGHPRHEDTLPTAYPNDFCSYGKRKEDNLNVNHNS